MYLIQAETSSIVPLYYSNENDFTVHSDRARMVKSLLAAQTILAEAKRSDVLIHNMTNPKDRNIVKLTIRPVAISVGPAVLEEAV